MISPGGPHDIIWMAVCNDVAIGIFDVHIEKHMENGGLMGF